MIFSGVVRNEETYPAVFVNGGDLSVTEIAELAFDFEEADLRIIPHIKWNLIYKYNSNCLVLSNDTDVVVLLLFYISNFIKFGLKNLWILFGKGDNKVYIPIHHLYRKMGEVYCKSILKCHIGTGCDYLSKIGTKYSALKAKPEEILNKFGEFAELTHEQMVEAESYLVKVYNSCNNDKSITFDELRLKSYKKGTSSIQLPPTSFSINQGHIPRWWFLYKRCSNLLDQAFDHLNPIDYGWYICDGELLPVKHLNLIPDELCNACSCKNLHNVNGCKSNRCKCKKNNMKCTDFCNCFQCKNC